VNDELCIVFLSWRGRKIAKTRPLSSSYVPACLPACPSVRTEQLGSHWTYFHEIWYFRLIKKSGEKIKVSLKPDKGRKM
jgi:hypothetical protein